MLEGDRVENGDQSDLISKTLSSIIKHHLRAKALSLGVKWLFSPLLRFPLHCYWTTNSDISGSNWNVDPFKKNKSIWHCQGDVLLNINFLIFFTQGNEYTVRNVTGSWRMRRITVCFINNPRFIFMLRARITLNNTAIRKLEIFRF